VLWETVSAVNRSSFSWFERDFGLNTAVRTDYFSHFSGAAAATSETTTTTTVVVSAPPVAVSAPGRISSVIKTHSCFTSAYSGYSLVAIKIRSYTILLLKTKMKFLITDYMFLYFYCQYVPRHYDI
jgi:hypothetical protein